MPRTDTVRAQLALLVRRTPFQPFAVNLENWNHIIVEHPENMAFDSSEKGVNGVVIISKRLMHYTTLPAITSVVELDTGEPSA